MYLKQIFNIKIEKIRDIFNAIFKKFKQFGLSLILNGMQNSHSISQS